MSNEQQQQEEPISQQMIEIQGSIINKLIKRIFPEKVVTGDFKKQFSKALSIFILYSQSGQVKKKFTKTDLIQFLQREGFGKVADDLRRERVCQNESIVSRKKVTTHEEGKQINPIGEH